MLYLNRLDADRHPGIGWMMNATIQHEPRLVPPLMTSVRLYSPLQLTYPAKSSDSLITRQSTRRGIRLIWAALSPFWAVSCVAKPASPVEWPDECFA